MVQAWEGGLKGPLFEGGPLQLRSTLILPLPGRGADRWEGAPRGAGWGRVVGSGLASNV